MRHAAIAVVSAGLLFGVGISEQDIANHKQWMDDAQDWKEEIREALNATPVKDIAEPARRLVGACEKELEFWRRAGVAEAVLLAKSNLRAAKALQNDRTQRAFAELDAGCKACHDLHLERRLTGAGKS